MKNPLVIAHINDWRVTGLPQSKDVGVSMLAFGLGGPCHARGKGHFQLQEILFMQYGDLFAVLYYMSVVAWVVKPPCLMSRSWSLAPQPVSVATRETILTVLTAPPRFLIWSNI